MLAAFPKLKGSLRHCLFVLLFYALLFLLFFSPALLSGNIIGPLDGISYHLPYFYAEKVLWDNLLLGGFPMMADPQVMTWYPPAALLSHLPGGWNLFVVLAYVLASCFTYGYLYRLTESKLAAAIGGIIYGMSGFMVAQLDHATIIHGAAWLPLIIWSLEALRRKPCGWWFAAGCVAVACNNLAGHSQIFVYSMMLSAAYALALGWIVPAGSRKRFYLLSALMLALGTGLAAIQMVPTLELARLSVRSGMSFEQFTTFSLPPGQILMLIFPVLYGGLRAYGAGTYFGEWSLLELTGYVGLLPLLLAAMGLMAHRQRLLSIFWLSTGLIALLLALGSATPLAWVAYRLPVLNLFRVPARHLFLVALAVSVLAGLGVRAMLELKATRRLVLRAVLVFAALMAACLIGLQFAHLDEYAAGKTVAPVSLLPWRNMAVGVPLLLSLVSALALLHWHARPASLLRGALLLLALVLDLGSFGWFYARENVAPREWLQTPAHVARYRDALKESNQRAIPVEGVMAPHYSIRPNLSRLWDVPSASIYGPLILSRVQQLLPMHPVGNLTPEWQKGGDRSLDLMAVRYVFSPRLKLTEELHGINWFTAETEMTLGSGCNIQNPSTAVIELPQGASATKLAIVSLLGCSMELANDEEVLRVSVTDGGGKSESITLRAGADSSEWAYDCGDVRPRVKHGRAAIFRSFPVDRGGAKCEGHEYLATLPLKESANPRSIELQWVGKSGTISIKRMSLVDERTGRSFPLGAAEGSLMDTARWRHIEDIDETSIFENLRAMPRAWLVPEVLSVKPTEALGIIKSSRLPDGRGFDPYRTALVEEPLGFKADAKGEAGKAEVLSISEGGLEVRTSSSTRSFLVLSEVYYPGWEATVDGASTPIYAANFGLRGVIVPAGSHAVRLRFRPGSLYRGAGLSGISLLVIAITLWRISKTGRKGELQSSYDAPRRAERPDADAT